MQLNIEKNNFYKIDSISSIKSKVSKINDLEVINSNVVGDIQVSLYYYDLDGKECFELITIPFELDLDSLEIKEVTLVKTNVYVIEGNGINVEYELEVEYNTLNTSKEIEVIGEEDIEIFDNIDELEENEIEQIKEETKEYYEDILEKNLRENVKVVSTKTEFDTDDFLNFFEQNTEYFKLKCVHIDSEKELNDLSIKYNITMEELLAGYDVSTKKVIFKIA